MGAKKLKASKSKDLGGGKGKAGTKGRIKKKRKHASKKFARTNFPYSLLPRHKRLARKQVAKLDNENDQYKIARGVDALQRLDHGKTLEEVNERPTPEEQAWVHWKKGAPEYIKWRDNKMTNIANREIARRSKAEKKRELELLRKIYRKHPNDGLHYYLRGYKKTRHRITKKRFMSCVDVSLFQEILKESKDLLDSPLWTEKSNLKNLSIERAKELKDHLHQFDVIVEALKQGIFDREGCDDFPLHKVRRKRKKPGDTPKEPKKKKKREARSNSSSDGQKKRLRRRFSFPPYESEERLDIEDENNTKSKMDVIKAALSTAASWIHAKKSQPDSNRSSRRSTSRTSQIAPNQKQQGDVPSKTPSSVPVQNRKSEAYTSRASFVPKSFKWSRRGTLKSFPPILQKQSEITSSENSEVSDDNLPTHSMYGELLTINVPDEPGPQRKFIRTLVERKTKKRVKRNTKSAAEKSAKHEDDSARQRHERAEKLDPLQRLHQDEKDSDIWTATSTTTTDGYASWRRPRDLRNVGNKQEVLAHKVDTTLVWRVVLLLIVLWEIGCFVKERMDDVYYWIFSSHLYRENIWLFEPSLFPPMEKYLVIHLQEWVHVIISGISVSIIHRENECVSLLFASSMLVDGLLEVGVSTHDYVYLPQRVDWLSISLTAFHAVWKVFIICLFIGYHYYCAGYIRKAREFKHRKTKLHNHEIKAKGTKGLQKRRMAWRWMTCHARSTNLKHLKRKYPNVKDGNFPEDEVAKEIKFSEPKELRLYTLNHNLNIGFPYNKLDDMKRYVFKKLEKSDYTDNDVIEETETMRKKLGKLAGRTSRAITVEKWKTWEAVREEKDRAIESRLPSVTSISFHSHAHNAHAKNNDGVIVSRPTHARSILNSDNLRSLTIGPSYSHREFEKQRKEYE